MFNGVRLIALMVLSVWLVFSSQVMAEDDSSLKQRVTELESRVQKLERLLDERFSDQRWNDSILWSRIRPDMQYEEVRKLLGKPARVEEAIFTTWYYHKTSKLHAHVWFDEGKVLGWEGPEPEQRRTPRLKP